MRIESLEMSRVTYGDNRGKLAGSIAFKDINNNEVTVNLTPKAIMQLLETIKDEVISEFNASTKAIPRAFENALNENALLELDN